MNVYLSSLRDELIAMGFTVTFHSFETCAVWVELEHPASKKDWRIDIMRVRDGELAATFYKAALAMLNRGIGPRVDHAFSYTKEAQ